jgi:uncharacterized membrane protein YkoI
MFRSKLVPAAMVAVMAIAGAGSAFAANDSHRNREESKNEQAEIGAIMNAKTSLAQAIAAAERQTGGKAVETGLDNQNGVMAYEVLVANGTTVQKVLVDLDSGQVTKVAAGRLDHEDHEEDDD